MRISAYEAPSVLAVASATSASARLIICADPTLRHDGFHSARVRRVAALRARACDLSEPDREAHEQAGQRAHCGSDPHSAHPARRRLELLHPRDRVRDLRSAKTSDAGAFDSLATALVLPPRARCGVDTGRSRLVD